MSQNKSKSKTVTRTTNANLAGVRQKRTKMNMVTEKKTAVTTATAKEKTRRKLKKEEEKKKKERTKKKRVEKKNRVEKKSTSRTMRRAKGSCREMAKSNGPRRRIISVALNLIAVAQHKNEKENKTKNKTTDALPLQRARDPQSTRHTLHVRPVGHAAHTRDRGDRHELRGPQEMRQRLENDGRHGAGLLLLAGVYRSRNEALEHEESGRAIFCATMSLKRFHALSQLLRFDDRETRGARRASDKLAAIRDVWDAWVRRLPCLYNPGPNVHYRRRTRLKYFTPHASDLLLKKQT